LDSQPHVPAVRSQEDRVGADRDALAPQVHHARDEPSKRQPRRPAADVAVVGALGIGDDQADAVMGKRGDAKVRNAPPAAVGASRVTNSTRLIRAEQTAQRLQSPTPRPFHDDREEVPMANEPPQDLKRPQGHRRTNLG
jgi:hypothetical protein